MLVSYKWLQTYFDEKLPDPEKLGELLTMRVLELDGLKKVDDDAVLDLKVLADRAHYCLSHRGIAKELSAILGNPLAHDPYLVLPDVPGDFSVRTSDAVELTVTDSVLCRRAMKRLVTDIKVGESPAWLKERLRAIGQKSINNVVDITNFVTFDLGQPVHAFDLDKLAGEKKRITIRPALPHEQITTLDGKTFTLDPSVLVIADDNGPLDIAGIKGGTHSGIDAHTRRILLSVCSFNPSTIRLASQMLKLRTDASSRFENGITPELVPIAMAHLSKLVAELAHGKVASDILDIYPNPAKRTVLSVNLSEINKRLGIDVPRDGAITILKSLSIVVEENGDDLKLTIPYERLDLAIPEDIVEEVGRLYGYEKLPDQLPPPGVASLIDKRNYYIEKIRDTLVDLGFSEVYLYSLVEEGDYEIELPLAEDKKFLRTHLTPGIINALVFNARNAPLLGLTQIKLFEFGSVFPKNGEKIMLGLGITDVPGHKGIKATDEMRRALKAIHEPLSNTDITPMQYLNIEFPIDDIIGQFPEPPQESAHYEINRTATFQKFSSYPFIARDIALWVDEGVQATDMETVLKQTAGDLLVRLSLFDEYKKDARISYAFRLVFQSPDRTLTNEEVNAIMIQVTIKATERNWKVR